MVRTYQERPQPHLDWHAWEGASAQCNWLRTGDMGVYLDGDLYVTGRRADPAPAVEAIRVAVLDRHGIAASDVRFVAAGSIPRTTSGKLARGACRAAYVNGVWR